jgi:prepilin-type N-terminal cleavage/methylation domain-containing protein
MPFDKQKGFTLIELLIVIIVIAALSTVLISIIDPAGSQGRARDGVRLNNVKNLAEGIESYRQIEGSYPLDSDPADPDSLLRTTYIKEWPKPFADDGTLDPVNWSYEYYQAGSGFILYTPNSKSTCYKYQTDWYKMMDCPAVECTNNLSSSFDCSDF